MQVYFLLSCKSCKWFRKCGGTTKELEDLVEFKPCSNCHGARKFKCPQCATIMKIKRVNVPDGNIPKE